MSPSHSDTPPPLLSPAAVLTVALYCTVMSASVGVARYRFGRVGGEGENLVDAGVSGELQCQDFAVPG